MNNFTLKQRLGFALIAITFLVLGILFGRWWAPHTQTATDTHSSPSAASETKKVLYWYDPMVPNQHFDQPGQSPFMDMPLVPKYADSDSSENTDTKALRINPRVTQQLGMRLATAEPIELRHELDVTGTLAFNQRNLAIVQLRSGGFVEKVWPLAVGDKVAKGQAIATLTIPDWVSAQYEYLAIRRVGDEHLLHSARVRLQLLGMPETLIEQLEHSGKAAETYTVTAPISGVIDSLEVKLGMTLSSGKTLVRINNLDNLWLDAAIPEAQAQQLAIGDNAQFYSPNPEDPVATGTLESLLPVVDSATRTLTARILLDNRDGKLKPGTSGRVHLSTRETTTGLAIPTEAIIHSGKQAMVMLADGEGTFRSIPLQIGREVGDKTLVLSGLTEGQQVVASGQFLLDSEASLLGIRAEENATTELHDEHKSGTQGLHQTQGEILEVGDDFIRLRHSDFISLADNSVSMPAMTMRFMLDSALVAQAHKVGEKVQARARIDDEGNWVIVSLTTLASSHSSQEEHQHD